MLTTGVAPIHPVSAEQPYSLHCPATALGLRGKSLSVIAPNSIAGAERLGRGVPQDGLLQV